MSSRKIDFSISIGGAAGQGIATPGNILARMFIRRGLHFNAYNAYQSIIPGGHIILTLLEPYPEWKGMCTWSPPMNRTRMAC